MPVPLFDDDHFDERRIPTLNPFMLLVQIGKFHGTAGAF